MGGWCIEAVFVKIIVVFAGKKYYTYYILVATMVAKKQDYLQPHRIHAVPYALYGNL